MNSPTISDQIPPPGSFRKKPLSDLAKRLQTLSIYDPALDNKLIISMADGAQNRQQLQSKIWQVACSMEVGIKVCTRYNPSENVIYVYRYE